MAERPRRSLRGPVVITMGVALMAGAGGAAITYSGVFGADHLVVVGARNRSDAEILARAGLERGVNVFHLDTSVPEAALLADPWIAEVTVEASLPSTITVRIVERRPVAVCEGEVVADDGTILPGAATDGLPTIDATGTLDAAARTAAAAVVDSLRPAQRHDLAEVLLAPDGSVTLVLGSVSVRWGAPGDDEKKAASLAAVLRAVGEDADVVPEAIDVSVPDAPAVVSG